jgi:4-hydroxybenzoate polyprenyltransferase
MAGEVGDLGAWYYGGLSLAAVLAGYQQYLIREHDRGLCFRAFLNNNWFGLLIFAGLVMHFRG